MDRDTINREIGKLPPDGTVTSYILIGDIGKTKLIFTFYVAVFMLSTLELKYFILLIFLKAFQINTLNEYDIISKI